jgi:hypothetical protein
MKAVWIIFLYQPGRRDEAGWYALCFGSDTESMESEASSGGVPPLLSILLSMNQVYIVTVTADIFITCLHLCTQVSVCNQAEEM